MEREAVLVGIDVGTSKVCALIGEVSRDGKLTIMGHGTVPASGLKKGVVINIDQTVRSIQDAVERAERLSGWKIDRAFVGVGGQHVESLNSRGQVAVTAHHREVTREDVIRAIEVARAVTIPSNRQEIHVERRGFTVDGQEGVKDPLGMSALRLEVETHIVTASATAVQNLTKCVSAAGVKIDELVVDGLASAEAVLSDEEKELGILLIDLGGGTTDVALFRDGAIWHTGVLPLGGDHISNDVAVGLRTPTAEAEELKKRHGCALTALVREDEVISVPSVGGRKARELSRQILSEIIQPRVEEIFTLVARELTKAGLEDAAAAGVVVTGGASILPGVPELAEQVFDLPVRRGLPTGVGGLSDVVRSPIYSTGVGLALYGARGRRSGVAMDESGGSMAPGALRRLRDWFSELF